MLWSTSGAAELAQEQTQAAFDAQSRLKELKNRQKTIHGRLKEVREKRDNRKFFEMASPLYKHNKGLAELRRRMEGSARGLKT